jgi:hypothetical protein
LGTRLHRRLINFYENRLNENAKTLEDLREQSSWDVTASWDVTGFLEVLLAFWDVMGMPAD